MHIHNIIFSELLSYFKQMSNISTICSQVMQKNKLILLAERRCFIFTYMRNPRSVHALMTNGLLWAVDPWLAYWRQIYAESKYTFYGSFKIQYWNSTNNGQPNFTNFFLIPWYRRIQACKSSQQILPAMDSCDFNMLTRDLRTRADRFQSWLVSVIPPWLESHLMKRLGKILKSRLIS